MTKARATVPLGARDWMAHVRLGTGMSWTVIAMVAVYLAMGEDHRHGRLLWPALGMAALITFIVGRLPWPRLISNGLVLPVMMAWSMTLVPLSVILTLLDGGSRSPMALIIVLPLVFAAMMYPVRATVAVGSLVVLGQCIIAGMAEQFEPGRVAIEVAVLALIAVMAAIIARNHDRSVARTERLADQLRELAYRDNLTGCLNHRGFRERLEAEVADAQRLQHPVALLHADLDNFKRVNDAFGHPVGDQILATVGTTLRRLARRSDVVGRVGGEEFVLLLPRTGADEAEALAERLRAAVGQLDDPVRVTMSFGVSALPELADTEEALVTSADRALYAAKRAGRDRVVVAGSSASKRRSSHLAATAVATLLHEDGQHLTSVFQPLVDLRTGEVHGYEALSRISASNVPPDRWLAAADQEGLRVELELAMLDAAVATYQAARWHEGRSLFVNLGPDLLATGQLWSRLESLPPGTVIELSERLVLSDSSSLASAARRWVDAGVDLAIDDLGAGYANLRAVLELEPRYVKLDRSLVSDIHQRRPHRSLVSALVTFADDIGTTIVAEGAERPEELRALADLGVPLAQGYGLARPGLPPERVRWSPVPGKRHAAGVASAGV